MGLVLDELENLPVVDHRYRLWPWSLRTLGKRRGASPGTVHKHIQALRDAGILVEDGQGRRLLVDTVRLAGPHNVDEPATASVPAVSVVTPPAASDVDGHLVAAIDALTAAAEARPDFVEDLAEIIGRLARMLEARDRAPDLHSKSRDRAPVIEERKNDRSRSSISLDLHRARRATTPQARESRATGTDRTPQQLFELLAPLDPARHVSYTEGVLAALAPYDDDQVRHAVKRAAVSPAQNPVGLLVDRANREDPAYFPEVTSAQPHRAAPTAHGDDCRCAGVGVIPADADHTTYLACPGPSAGLDIAVA